MLLAILAASAFALVACGDSHTGNERQLPARPYTLDIHQVDPCAALTEHQRAALDLRPGSGGTAQGGTSRGCAWISDAGLGYTFQTLTSDASSAIGAEPTATIVEVAGFGAVQSAPPAEGTGLPFCQVVLDVADGASLRAQLQVIPRAPDADRRTVDGTCADVREFAALVLDNLHAQQSR